jgi:hypothetical protein
MTTRQTIIGVVALVTVLFAYVTVDSAIDEGVNVLTVVSVGVLALFVIALLGMLSQPPEE